jgi:hypothetical protein
MGYAEHELHSFDSSSGGLRRRLGVSALFGKFVSFRSHGFPVLFLCGLGTELDVRSKYQVGDGGR